jgi:putative transposase
MENDTTNSQSMSISSRDVLTEILRQGSQKMLADAIQNEVAEYLDSHAHFRDDRGQRLVVRNGHLPTRMIQSGLV